MSTISHYKEVDINKKNPLLSQIRTTVETAFYGNNFERVTDISKAYYLAKNCPSTIVTDVPIKHTQELGLPVDSKMLVNNHGKIVGRTAAARHIIGHLGEDTNELAGVLRDAIFEASDRKFYKTEVYVGLDEDFMLKSHLAVPKGYEFNMLSYMLNFQPVTSEYEKMYQAFHKYEEGDIFIYADPEFKDENYPNGLVIIDAEHNVAAILGLRYFGELKKATLTLAWAIAHRHGYTASHGGEKVFRFDDKDDKVFAFYGLSGSGKSTLTHAKHGGKYDIDKEITLQILEDIANEKVNWEKFGSLDGMYYLPFEKYPVDFKDKSYTEKLKRRLEIRLEWIEKYEGNHPDNPLPAEIKDCLSNLINELN